MASRQPLSAVLAAAPAAPGPFLPELPEAAVSAILQRVPLHDRLSSCALVCRGWAAAAAAATSHLQVHLWSGEQRQQLEGWLGKHAVVVQQLSVCRRKWEFFGSIHEARFQLPVCQMVQLLKLDLYMCDVHLPAVPPQGVTPHASSSSSTRSSSSSRGSQGASGTPGSAAALLPQLQELRLWECRLTEQLVLQLLSARALTKLTWDAVRIYDESWKAVLPHKQVLSTLWHQLQQLPHLSWLQLRYGAGITVAEATHVSTLQHLNSLDILLPCANVPTLAVLVPGGLSGLTMSIFSGAAPPDMPAACITRLSSLASLDLSGVHMAPSCLSSLTGLRELRLAGPEYDDPASGPRELLGALQQLTQLRRLRLQWCHMHRIQEQQEQQEEGEGGGGYQCFSALTACSQLTSLALECYEMPVPMGAFDHMFPTGRVLPHLRELTLKCVAFPMIGWRPGHCVEAAQVAMIVASCPALAVLVLDRVTPMAFGDSCLPQLPPGLTITIENPIILNPR